jgi:hypothetical protein
MRAKAFETEDGALRCYLDQLPSDRCVFCARPTAPRMLRIGSPVHSWSGSGGTHYQQVRGRVMIAVCRRCAPGPRNPLIIAALIGVASFIVAKLGGLDMIWYVFGGILATLTFAAIGISRRELRVAEIDEDDHMLKLAKVDAGVASEILALGAEPHPRAPLPVARVR